MAPSISIIENLPAQLDSRLGKIEKKYAGDSYAPTFQNSWVDYASV